MSKIVLAQIDTITGDIDFNFEINNNIPYFTDAQKKLSAFEYYSPLDSLNRCRTTIAMIDSTLLPTEDRGSIGMIKPSGWQTIRYDNIIRYG